MTLHSLVLLSFVVGLVPAVLLVVFYGVWSAWEHTQAGRAMFALVLVTALSYGLSTLVAAFPKFFGTGGDGAPARIAIRFVIAVVLWNLFRLLVLAQRASTHHDGPVEDQRSNRELLERISVEVRDTRKQTRFLTTQMHALAQRLDLDMSQLRDQFDADEQSVTDQLTALNTSVSGLSSEVAAVAAALQALPTSVDNLTQDDLDQAHAQGDALVTANQSLSDANAALTALVTPAPAAS